MSAGPLPPLRTDPLMPIERHYIRQAFIHGEDPAEIGTRMRRPEGVVMAVLREAVAAAPALLPFAPIGIDDGSAAETSHRTFTPTGAA